MKKISMIVAVILMISMLLCACSERDSIVGSWLLTQDGVGATVTFNEDGTGSVSMMGGFFSSSFTYTIDGRTLTITAEDGSDSMLPFDTGKYSIDDGTLAVETDDYIYYLTKK